jgi:hypothetical protein
MVMSPAAEKKVAADVKKKADLEEKKNAKAVAAAKKKADLAEKKNAEAAAAAKKKADLAEKKQTKAADKAAIKAAAKAAAEEKKNAPSSKNSTVAKNGFKAEAAICSQEGIKLALEPYLGSPIERIICIKGRKKSDIKIYFENGSESKTIQNKDGDGDGDGRGYSVDRRKVDAYNDEPLTKLLKKKCLKQGTEKPVISSDISKKVINMCMLGIEEEYAPKYFTHTKSDKTTGQIKSMSICPTEKLLAFLHSELYPEMVPKRTCVHLSPNIYLQRKGGGKTDHSPDDIQMKFRFTKAVEKLYTPIFPLPQTKPQ